MAHHVEAGGVAAVFGNVLRGPLHSLGAITGHDGHLHVGRKAVVDNYGHHALLGQPPTNKPIDVFVATIPVATVNKHHHGLGRVFVPVGAVNVQDVPFGVETSGGRGAVGYVFGAVTRPGNGPRQGKKQQ